MSVGLVGGLLLELWLLSELPSVRLWQTLLAPVLMLLLLWGLVHSCYSMVAARGLLLQIGVALWLCLVDVFWSSREGVLVCSWCRRVVLVLDCHIHASFSLS